MKTKILWRGSCKHYGFIGTKRLTWNEEQNHYLATVRGTLEKGQYLNSQNKISRYSASRYSLGPLWVNIGYVSGYGPDPLWFCRFGYTGKEYERSIVLNVFNLTAITMKTAYRWVEELDDQNAYAWTSVLSRKLKRKDDG